MAKILVVDDTAITRAALRMAFEMSGHQVMDCAGLEPAKKLLADNRFDGLVTDVHYPGKLGLESGGKELLSIVAEKPAAERPKILIVSVDHHSAAQLAATFVQLAPKFCRKKNCLRQIDFVR